MKLRIYSIAAMAFVKLTFYSMAGHAQQAPAPAQAPTPPQVNVQTPQVYVYEQGSATTINPNVYYIGPAQSTDTAYTRKMKKLQEQQRALSKEMGELAREHARKLTDLTRERMTLRTLDMGRRSDSAFSRSFSRIRTVYGNSDERLQKEVENGNVKEKVKTYSKSYSVDKDDKLKIENTYGNITVNTWNKNEFKVDVQVKAYTTSDEDSQKLLDETKIVDSKDNNVVSFKTIIDNSRSSNWGMSIMNDRVTMVHKVIVTYTVYMPVKSALNIKNTYGVTTLPNLDGKVTINNTYGSLITKTLSNSDNVINLQYVTADIASLAGSNLDVQYGSLKLDAADKLNLDIQYSPAKIGKLTTSGKINVQYGSGVQIADLDKNLKALSIISSYAPVKLNVTPAINADFDVVVNYTNFTYGDNAVSLTSKVPGDDTKWSPTRSFKGHIGKGNSDKMIVIKANYGGGVKFE